MALIGINGKIGSGKDTVGKMVQYLTAIPRGPKPFRPGVDYSIDSPWQIHKFATAIKRIASVLTGIPASKFEDQEFKKSYLGPEWDYWKYVSYPYRFESKEDAMVNTHLIAPEDRENLELHRMTVRQLLQELGTEAIRDRIHPQAWINAAFADIDGQQKVLGRFDTPEEASEVYEMAAAERLGRREDEQERKGGFIFTDMRFPNELEAIKNRKGVTIRVKRNAPGAELADKIIALHSSETALDKATFDYEIDNSGTLDELLRKVREILITEKIIT